MTDEHNTTILHKIEKTYSRTVVVAGSLMGFMLCTYFFTLGLLIDGGYTFMLWLEIVTTVLFVFGLIYLKPLSLVITRVLLSGDADRRRMLRGLTVAQIEKALL